MTDWREMDGEELEELIETALENGEERTRRAAMIGFAAGAIIAMQTLGITTPRGDRAEALIRTAKEYRDAYMKDQDLELELGIPMDGAITADLDLTTAIYGPREEG